MTKAEQDSLKAMVDKHGIFAILDTLSGLCGIKAEYIRINWTDENLADAWEDAESAIDAAASKVLDLFL